MLGFSRRGKEAVAPNPHLAQIAALTGPYNIRSDVWEPKPGFGFERLAYAVAKVIRESTPQLTLAMYGEWGTGKTTLLHLIEERIEGPECPVVWFDMWEHRGQDDVAPFLLTAIANALPDSPEISKRLLGFARAALASTTLTAGQVTFTGADFLDQIDQMWAKAPSLNRDHLASIVRDWKRLLQPDGKPGRALTDTQVSARSSNPLSATSSTPRIVVFVDNVDRCLPEQAVHMLEQTSTLFDFEGMVFLIAGERERLALAVETTNNLPKGQGAIYLEKLVQVEWVVPRLDPTLVPSWIQEDLSDQALQFSATDADLIAKTAEMNPRRIKRLINNVRMQLCAARPEFAEEPELVLGSTLLLEANADLWRELTSSMTAREQALQPTMARPTLDDLIQNILESDGGERFLALTDAQMSRFLTSAESTIAATESPVVREAVEQARSQPDVRARTINLIYSATGLGILATFGLAGALSVLSEDGYTTSIELGSGAGALIAALHASGFTAREILQVLSAVDLEAVVGEGSAHGLLRRGSRSNEVEAWVGVLLASKGIRTFGDLRANSPVQPAPLCIAAQDSASDRNVLLPALLESLGLGDSEPSLAALVAVNLLGDGEVALPKTGDGLAHTLKPAIDIRDITLPAAPNTPTWAIHVDTARAAPGSVLQADTIVIPLGMSADDSFRATGSAADRQMLMQQGIATAQLFLSSRGAS